MAHLGLGAFHRAHQAWYARSTDWGIAAFTGRSPEAARALAAQDGVYTLIERDAEGDRAQVIESIVAAHDGTAPEWEQTLADPSVALLTVTVTEAGYAPDAAAPARIAAGLTARYRAGGAPFAVVSCDNLSHNGDLLAGRVRARVSDEVAAWMAQQVSFVSTMVDRITPATTEVDRAAARALTGWDDAVPVVTEPFSEWVLAGAFPAGRPDWPGVRIVPNVTVYEQRKLWLLNATHSLLAYAGQLRGFTTIAEAFADPDLRCLVEALWAEQRAVIDLPATELDDCVAALRVRYANPRIEHRLAQIGRDGTAKLAIRIVDAMTAREAAGLAAGDAQRAALAAWGTFLATHGPTDPAAESLAVELAGTPHRTDQTTAARVLAALRP